MDSRNMGERLLVVLLLPVVVLLAFLSLAGCRSGRLLPEGARSVLPADGRVHAFLTLRRKGGGPIEAGAISVAAEPRASLAARLLFVQKSQDAVTVLMRTPVEPGQARLRFRWHGKQASVAVAFALDAEDSFGDGTPDFLRLHSARDRRAFRAWFTGIAEEEFAAPRLPPEIDDCAALLRYCYRQALAEHSAGWLGRQSLPAGLLSQPSVEQYQYPRTPLAAALFRVRPGPFISGDLQNGSFAQFADARSLMQWNTYPVGRDMAQARPGDLLFFRQLEQNSQYHSMIVTGKRADWLIYHTGPIGKAKGGMRRISREDLLRYPDARWRPVPGNSNFLGVYRWNILREGD